MPEQSPSKKPRGRPKRSIESRTKTRLQIEAAATKLFQAEGYSAVSMRRVATEVGCSPMTLYGYFDSKVDLLRSLWGQVFDELFDGLTKKIAAVPTEDAKLAVLAHAYVAYWIQHEERYRMVFMAEGVSQSDVRIFVDHPSIPQHFAIFYDLVAGAIKPPVSDADIAEKTDFLLSALHGIVHTQITISGFGWSSPARLVDQAVDAVRRQP